MSRTYSWSTLALEASDACTSDVKMKIVKGATEEMNSFQDDLLAAIKDMNSGCAARSTTVNLTVTSEALEEKPVSK